VDNEQVDAHYRQAAMKALESFPVDAVNVVFVDHSENITFRVEVRDGDTDYVLRLHRPGYSSISELESERIWTRALKEAGIAVQDALQTHQGQHYVLIDIPGSGEQRYAGITTWFDGTPLYDFLQTVSDGAERERLFRRIGEIIASFHNQSTRWKAPPRFKRRRLDLEGLLGDAPFWGRFWDHEDLTKAERVLLLRARDELRAALSAYGERSDNFGLIHADFTPDNIIYGGDDLAVIDFDDSAYGWHMYDIASALLEYGSDNDFESLRDALLDGYRDNRPLAKKDFDMLPTFLLIRGMAIIGWFHQRPEKAGSSFLQRTKNWVLAACESPCGISDRRGP
jgi:Ser/Thr protein kinase RdoA (MazF antagonist)